MEYVKLGSTGLEVSMLCLGGVSYGEPHRGTHAWTLPDGAERSAAPSGLDAGIAANVYSDG